MLKDKRPNTKEKTGVFEGLVVPIMIYGVETWGLMQVKSSRLDVFEAFGWCDTNGHGVKCGGEKESKKEKKLTAKLDT